MYLLKVKVNGAWKEDFFSFATVQEAIDYYEEFKAFVEPEGDTVSEYEVIEWNDFVDSIVNRLQGMDAHRECDYIVVGDELGKCHTFVVREEPGVWEMQQWEAGELLRTVPSTIEEGSTDADAIANWIMAMNTNESRKFRTSDGYTFFEIDGKWVDSLDAESVDMTFDASPETGLPIDSDGNAVEGSLY